MEDYPEVKLNNVYEKSILDSSSNTTVNLRSELGNINNALSNYTQEIKRPKYDADLIEIIEVVRILNNLAPHRMPIYNFVINEINGDHYYRPDGSLLLVREYDSDIIRDYYASRENNGYVDRVLEHDRDSGRLKAKIEPTNRQGSKLKTNITIFDWKINNKYTLFQLTQEGIVGSITEFTGKGKSFKTLFRDTFTLKPVKYLEGKDSEEHGFVMIDCLFDSEGKIARIKKYASKKEVQINYTQDTKIIKVKNANN